MSLFTKILNHIEQEGGQFSATHIGITLYQKKDVIHVTCALNNVGMIAYHVQEWAKKSIHENDSLISFVVELDHIKIYY